MCMSATIFSSFSSFSFGPCSHVHDAIQHQYIQSRLLLLDERNTRKETKALASTTKKNININMLQIKKTIRFKCISSVRPTHSTHS